MRQRLRWRSGSVLVLFSIALLLAAPSQAGAAVPADLHLVASAGGIPPWKENRSIELFADGTGRCFLTMPEQREDGPMVRTARLRLPTAEMEALVEAIDAADFFSLPEENSSGADDGTYATLVVTAASTTHEVTVENIAVPVFDGIMRLLNSMVPPVCRLRYNEIAR